MTIHPRAIHTLARLQRATRALAAVLALAVGMTGCSGAPSPSGASGGSRTTGLPSGPSQVRSVEEAQALVFANRYDDATAAFLALLRSHPHDAAVHAAYALFLNYRQDFPNARAEAARAVADGPGMGRTHATLCRVDDWSNHLDAALAEGRRAVALDPDDVLGHLFLSEALADHGEATAARSEIVAARAHLTDASTVYERAEAYREEGNLGHDAGDLHAQLLGFQRAFQMQPGWVERPTELASAYLDNSDLIGAHNATQAALKLTPDAAALLSSLGRVAMFQQDYATADDAYTRLVALQPADATAQELAAHALFADRHDLDGAVTRLQTAITLHPSNEEAAAYLLYLERDVRNDEARGRAEVAAAVAAARDDGSSRGTPVAVPDVAAAQAVHAAAALATLNLARTQAGLSPVTLDAHLSTSAITHCFYWLFNNASPTVAKLGIHSETSTLPGYSGTRPGDRAVNFGWHDGPVGEDITHAGDAVLAVGQWVDSVFHRFPIMRPDLSRIGYADCSVGPLPMEDMEFGFGIVESREHPPTVFPGDHQTAVPGVFVDNELPDPVPDGRPRTTGYPVTVSFDPAARATVSSFTLTGAAGGSLEAYRLAPDRLDGNTATLLPVAVLAAHSTFTAHVAGTVDGAPFDRVWTFTTA